MRNEERQLNVMNILLLFEYNMKTKLQTCETSWNLMHEVIISRPHSSKPQKLRHKGQNQHYASKNWFDPNKIVTDTRECC